MTSLHLEIMKQYTEDTRAGYRVCGFRVILLYIDFLLVRASLFRRFSRRSERRCSGGLAEQGNAVATKFIVLFSSSSSSSFWLITHSVVVVVKLPSQAGTYCGQLYTNVYTHSHQNRHVKGLLSEKLRMPTSQ